VEIARGEVRAVRWMLEDGHCHANPLVRRPVRFRRMAARSFVRIVQYEADVTVWPRCWNSVSSLRRAATFPAWRSPPADRLDVRLRYLSALPRTSAPNYGLPNVTGNVHRTWAAFLCGYPLLSFFFAHKKRTTPRCSIVVHVLRGAAIL